MASSADAVVQIGGPWAHRTGRLTGMLAAAARFGHTRPENAVPALGDAQSAPQR